MIGPKGVFVLLFVAATAWGGPPAVPVLRLDGPLNHGSAEYLTEGLERASRAHAPYVVMVLGGGGGLLPAARVVVQKMLESAVPVVAYLGPEGARAGAVPGLLLLAADIAAMAPGASLGGDVALAPEEGRGVRERFEAEVSELADSAARARGRNAHSAAKALRAKEPITGDQALQDGIVDFTAQDLNGLVAQLSGRKLRLAKGTVTALWEGEIAPTPSDPSLWQRLLAAISDARLAYGLLILGALLLAVELARPGSYVPAAFGGLCLLLSLWVFYWLPISYGALALIVVSFALILAEGYFPTYGLIAAAGLAAFITGSLWLMDTSAPDYQLPLGWILACAALVAAAGFGLSYGVLRGRRRKANSLEALVGEFGQARAPVTEQKGKVFVQGELWPAVRETEKEIGEGDVVVVTGVRGLSLIVEPRA
jgi:membrane-bound serine protease (ClpP class)